MRPSDLVKVDPSLVNLSKSGDTPRVTKILISPSE